jgi:hypothetical protein
MVALAEREGSQSPAWRTMTHVCHGRATQFMRVLA